MRSGNSPQLACWSILAFGFQYYNHRHHSRWEDLAAHCAMVEGPGLEPRLCDYQSQVLADYTIPPYNGAFKLPTQAPSAGTQVFTFIQLAKVFALSISNFTCSIYIPYPASGRRSIQLLRTSTRHLCIYLTYADLRLTNCLIFAHIRPLGGQVWA